MKPEDFVINLKQDQHDIETEERKHQEDVEQEMTISFRKSDALLSLLAISIALLAFVIIVRFII